MASENKCSGLKVLDPVQGLVDYINDIKPYHTKVIEVLVEYVYGEAVDVTIEDDLFTEIDMFRPEDPELGLSCADGFSLLPWGTAQHGWPIIPANQGLSESEYNTYPAFNVSAGSVTVPGDRTGDIRVGDQVHITTWIEDYTDPYNIVVLPDTSGAFIPAGSPTTSFFTVANSVYNAGSIDSWPGFPDPSYPQFQLGDEPHTVITLEGGYGALPTLGPNQVYVAFIRLAPLEIERVYSYSNSRREYNPSTLVLTQTPDEGYFIEDIQGVVVSTLDVYGVAIPDTGKVVVAGDLQASNIFVGDQVTISESNGNNGVFTITSLVYDGVYDQTTIGVEERIRDATPDGKIRIDIPSNVFVIDGDYHLRFHQGYEFNVAGGSFAGEYTTLTSDYVGGKTRVRTTQDIIDSSIDLSGSSAPGAMGVIKEKTFGYSDSTDFCATIPDTLVRVKMHERLTFDGLGIDLRDDLVVYNMENNDARGYELPLFTNISSGAPTIPESPTPPPSPQVNDYWFNTVTSAYTVALHRFTGSNWEPITTAYWLEFDTKLLYYRTKTAIVDTGWVLFLAEPPGFDGVQTAIGKTTLVGSETFTVTDESDPTFELQTYAVPAGSPLNDSLIRVTVNGVPAEVDLITATQFTIVSPVAFDDVVVAKVYDDSGIETNAYVNEYGTAPHRVLHDNVTAANTDRSYVLLGGNYIHRMIPENRLEVYQFGLGSGLIGIQQPITFPVVGVDGIQNSVSIEGDWRWLFRVGRVFSVRFSNNNTNDFTIASRSFDGTNTTIIVQQPDVVESPENAAFAQLFSRDLGVILGAVYDPVVDHSDPTDQVKTYVVPSTVSAYPDVNGITYTWYGPLRMELAIQFTTEAGTTLSDWVSMSNEFVYDDPTAGHPDDQVVSSVILEDLDFGWGMTYRWVIIGTDAGTSTIDIQGDVTGALDLGDLASIVGSQGNDGDYRILAFTYDVPNDKTIITLETTGSPVTDLPVDPPAGLEGYFQLENVDITSWFQYLIKEANSTTNVFTIAGNATSSVQLGMQFRVFGTQNDGVYTVTIAPVYDAATNTTDIQVASIVHDETGGWIESYRDYGISLIFEDLVGVSVAENADAALLLTSGSIIDAFDYNFFDIGSFDETLGTVLHLYSNS